MGYEQGPVPEDYTDPIRRSLIGPSTATAGTVKPNMLMDMLGHLDQRLDALDTAVSELYDRLLPWLDEDIDVPDIRPDSPPLPDGLAILARQLARTELELDRLRRLHARIRL